ncbi:hypothetical protein A3K01_02455 [candidate division WWE3 bacterium RIFOXYD1_FULL_43_17]|uniref:Uncharacterized protein n=3 Tax=Katanobacteria TaxID=422282 RepID=A0A1F4XGD5_UNCKA|nr:MAG: hypothetical protein UU59_C0040G0004 [candidate division WWE3 bacterium GW2011_GWE1_41_27]KKS59496.1 MAG: hypothetical protein UV26_C0022G0011 [candidate division WWE3 bacterium GW2011_GWF2_42_42]OGC80626.1 MAG: hypothetical protein A3K01_02455 [candidate division WWE3 bacterium RIFOXYD1_FULL_43_17]
MDEEYETVNLFFKKAEHAGLIVESLWNRTSGFHFDCNDAQIVTSTNDPREILKLVKLAYEVAAKSPNRGLHIAILRQTAKRSQLVNPVVYWSRSSRAKTADEDKEWVLLQDWLIDKGIDLKGELKGYELR